MVLSFFRQEAKRPLCERPTIRSGAFLYQGIYTIPRGATSLRQVYKHVSNLCKLRSLPPFRGPLHHLPDGAPPCGLRRGPLAPVPLDVAPPAERLDVRQVEGIAAPFEGPDVVRLKPSRTAASAASEAVALEGRAAGPFPSGGANGDVLSAHEKRSPRPEGRELFLPLPCLAQPYLAVPGRALPGQHDSITRRELTPPPGSASGAAPCSPRASAGSPPRRPGSPPPPRRHAPEGGGHPERPWRASRCRSDRL